MPKPNEKRRVNALVQNASVRVGVQLLLGAERRGIIELDGRAAFQRDGCLDMDTR